MQFREFMVQGRTKEGAQQVYVVRLHSLSDRYLATAFALAADGSRQGVELQDEPAIEAPPAHFFRNRRAYRRDLAMRVTQALQDGRGIPLPNGQQIPVSLAANLAGYQGGHPDQREDDLTDWSDVFDLQQEPFRTYGRDLPRQFGMLPGCTVQLLSTLGGYAMRAFYDLVEPHPIWGVRMPLIATQRCRENVDAAEFFGNRAVHRDRLLTMFDKAISDALFQPITHYTGNYDGIEDFDWIIQANLDPNLWPGGYPQPVMDDLADWRAPERGAA